MNLSKRHDLTTCGRVSTCQEDICKALNHVINLRYYTGQIENPTQQTNDFYNQLTHMQISLWNEWEKDECTHVKE